MNGEKASEIFIERLRAGKIRKDILPNHARNYTDAAEEEELNFYKKFILTSSYDFILSYKIKE